MQTASLSSFNAAARKLTFNPGIGLPGHCWATAQASMVCDVCAVSPAIFIRGAQARGWMWTRP